MFTSLAPDRIKRLQPLASDQSGHSASPGELLAGNLLHSNQSAGTTLERFQRNQKLPVNSLPPEILLVVFLPVAGFDRAHYVRLLPLRAVCKYWGEVIDATPELWEPIGSYLHSELQALIIQNSRHHPLSVEYYENIWDNDPEGQAKMEAFLLRMEPSASRWRVLDYRRALNSESDSRILSLPLHNLQHLQINGPTWRDLRPALDAPQLSILHVGGYSLDWRSLSDLQHLTLGSTNLTLDELLAVLHASPGLQYLSLEKIWPMTGIEGSWTSFTTKIPLPQLRNLRIHEFSARSIPFLLDRIEVPSLEWFKVTVRNESVFEDCIRSCESAGRYIGAFPLPRGEEQARVCLEAMTWQIRFAIGERTITIWNVGWTSDDGPLVRLAYLTSTIGRLDNRICEQVNILELDCWDGEEIAAYLPIIHSYFPQIRQIDLLDSGGGETLIGTVAQCLSSPLQLESGEEWIFPKLTKLEVDWPGLADMGLEDKILEVVDKRRETGPTEEITELRITSTVGAIDASIIEIFRQSVKSFDLTEL